MFRSNVPSTCRAHACGVIKRDMSVQGGVVDGFAAPGWEGVRNAFENNFGLNQELGAQLVIYKDGILQADLCGRNEAAKATAYGQVFECSERETCLIKKCTNAASNVQQEYSPEHLQCVFSSGKNVEAIAMAMLVDRGLVAYDDPVCKHWPEYGQV